MTKAAPQITAALTYYFIGTAGHEFEPSQYSNHL